MLKLRSFILRSKQRIAIIKSLSSQKTPRLIADETKLAMSHVSRTLNEFRKKGIVECLNPEEKIGRIYSLTQTGKQVLKKITSNK
jgi:DNA-binding MarR family transcriptional regulator